MARIRTIKPEFFTSAQIAECSPSARLLFVGLWCFCDDGGVHPANVKQLGMEVFPGDRLSEGKLTGMVNELLAAGLIVPFDAQGKTWWKVTGWHHQKIDRPFLRHPQHFDERSTNARRTLDDHSPLESKGMESKGVEGSGVEGKKASQRLASTSEYSDGFTSFWQEFPAGRRKDKPKAFAAFKAALAVTDEQTLIDRAGDYARSWEGTSQYVRGPTPWLNQQAWDEPPEAWLERRGKETNKAEELQKHNRDVLANWLHQTGELKNGDPSGAGPDDRSILLDLREEAQ
jgi:hypothetical protein